MRCQNVTSKHGGDRYGLLAFTEQGVAMLSGILKSERAVAVNIAIMRAFVAMRKDGGGGLARWTDGGGWGK